MGSEVEVLDLRRMFLGEESLWFLLEVAFRTAFMFVYTLILIRTAGKRGLGDVSPFELLLIVALGSAVGDPMFYPEVPLFHAMTVIAVIVLLQRAVAAVVERSTRVEGLLESTTTRLVANGVVDVTALRAERFARDELFMLLREEGVEQLGQVKRAYLEPSGRVSTWLFPKEEVLPGLPLIPVEDPDCPKPLAPGARAPAAGRLACVGCGFTEAREGGEELKACTNCEDADGWMVASRSPGGDDAQGGGRARRRRGLLGR